VTVAFQHVTVLLDEVVGAIAPRPSDVVVDCTLGGGGHSEALLVAGAGRVIGIDRDPAALAAASTRLAPFGDRFVAVRARFSELDAVLDSLGVEAIDGLVADLGVSSPQLDTPERGFSFRLAGPVDMRMDPDAPLSAADLVNGWPEADLADAIYELGEERRSRAVARAIVANRPFSDTATLAEVVARAVGRVPGGIHPATRTFQALRIAVNAELDEVRALLPIASARLRPGGRLAIIAFHSLEDRIVKQFLQAEGGKTGPRDPWGNPLQPARFVDARLVRPSDDDPNPRARSARLRIATRSP
jgi:16S rRNA (cytosine1402-N4)-methyltransferase